MSSAGLGDTSENTLLTEQWHTDSPIAIILPHTLVKRRAAMQLTVYGPSRILQPPTAMAAGCVTESAATYPSPERKRRVAVVPCGPRGSSTGPTRRWRLGLGSTMDAPPEWVRGRATGASTR